MRRYVVDEAKQYSGVEDYNLSDWTDYVCPTVYHAYMINLYVHAHMHIRAYTHT